jgi:hypothetical protein
VTERIVGRVLDKGGGGGEMGERVRLVIDGVDGRVHHIEMDAARAEEVGRGMIVVAGSAPPGPPAADRAGWRHCAGPAMPSGSTPITGASPPIFPRAGQSYDLARDRANIRISILSPIGLDSQIGHDGATWLDRELASPSRAALANAGFGREVTEAMERRRQSLVNVGHAVRLEDGRIRVSKDLITNLERAEVNRVGWAMATERGLTFSAAKTGEYVSGALVGSAQLASGRFAMIDDGIGFQLVPWATPARRAHRPACLRHSARCWRHRMEFRPETRAGI